MEELRSDDPLVGTELLHYRIIRRVGAGGMGVVYRADDLRLNRSVALKFLSGSSNDAVDQRKRFLREARAAAALNHPNICPVYEVVETPERVGLATYWVDGPDLRRWAQAFGATVPVNKAVEVAIQILEGLEAAHQRGVIHRDIKPENILMDAGDRVRIVDFGLARTADQSQITAAGTVLGTPAYMAPEQWVGGEVNAGIDLWAVGVVLHELLTGRHPFRVHDLRTLGHSILHEPHTPVRTLRPEVPLEIAAVIDRALAKPIGDRYPSASAMLADLRASTGTWALGDSRRTLTQAVSIPAFTGPSLTDGQIRDQPAPGAGPARENKPGISRRSLSWTVAGGAAAAALGGYYFWNAGWRTGPGDSGKASVAVLPFDNLSNESDYFSDGLTDELITTLSRVKTLRVVARTSSFQFRGKQAETRQIASQLNVNRLVTGSIQRSAGRIKVVVELVNAVDASVIWGSTFEGSAADVFSIQNRIESGVLKQLAAGQGQQSAASAGSTSSVEAHNHYLQGLYHWNRRSAVELETALAEFRRAVEIDPNYALAWSGLADTQVLRALFGIVPARQSMNEAKAAAQRALQLDPNLAEAHNSLGLILFVYDWDRTAAEAELKRALELNPGYATGHHWYGHYLVWNARFAEGFTELDAALQLDPLSLAIRTNIGWLRSLARQFDKGVEQLRETLRLDPRFIRAHLYLATILGQLRQFDEAFREMRTVRELSGENSSVIATEGWLYGRSGDMVRAAQSKTKLVALAQHTFVTAPEMVMLCVGMGQKQEALKWLENAVKERAPTLVWAGIDFRLDDLRREARFRELLSGIL
jgi:serine/threonine-protein kinase